MPHAIKFPGRRPISTRKKISTKTSQTATDRVHFTLTSKASPHVTPIIDDYDLSTRQALKLLKKLKCQSSMERYRSNCHVPHTVKNFKIINTNGKEFLAYEDYQPPDLAAQKIQLYIDCGGELHEEKVF